MKTVAAASPELTAAPPKSDWSVGLWAHFDVETDGLVESGKPLPLMLEVALVLTTPDLKIVAQYDAVIRHSASVLDALDPHPIVKEMHDKNGLWEDLRSASVTFFEAEEAMLALLDRHQSHEGLPVVWAGCSPAQIDRPLIAAHMPRLYKRIHYRTLDVSSLHLALKNYAGLEIPEIETSHRALDDVHDAIRALARCSEILAQSAPLCREINRLSRDAEEVPSCP